MGLDAWAPLRGMEKDAKWSCKGVSDQSLNSLVEFSSSKRQRQGISKVKVQEVCGCEKGGNAVERKLWVERKIQ